MFLFSVTRTVGMETRKQRQQKQIKFCGSLEITIPFAFETDLSYFYRTAK